jgi:hypothetical protein
MSRSSEGVEARITAALGKILLPVANSSKYLKPENISAITAAVMEVIPKSNSASWRVDAEGREEFSEGGFASKKDAIAYLAEKAGVDADKVKSESGGGPGVYYVRAIVGPGNAVTAWVRND